MYKLRIQQFQMRMARGAGLQEAQVRRIEPSVYAYYARMYILLVVQGRTGDMPERRRIPISAAFSVCEVKMPFCCSHFIIRMKKRQPLLAIFGGPFDPRSSPIRVADFGVIVPITQRFGCILHPPVLRLHVWWVTHA